MREAGGCPAPAERATGSSPGKFGRPLFLAKMRMVLVFFFFCENADRPDFGRPIYACAEAPGEIAGLHADVPKSQAKNTGCHIIAEASRRIDRMAPTLKMRMVLFFTAKMLMILFFVRGYLRARAVVGGVAKCSSTARYRCGYLRRVRDWTELSAPRSLSCRPASICPGRGQPASAMPARDAYRGQHSG